MKYILFGFIAAVAFYGCKKDKTLSYEINGMVTDASFNTGAANVTVTLYQTAAGGDPKISKVVTTGSDGSYSFTIKRDKIENFNLVFSKNNYFTSEKSFVLGDLDPKNTNSINASVEAKAWVRLIFNNSGSGGSISVSRTQGLTGCSECCNYTSFALSGATDTSFVCLNKGAKEYAYTWIYTGGTVFNTKSVITAPLDTTDLQLNF